MTAAAATGNQKKRSGNEKKRKENKKGEKSKKIEVQSFSASKSIFSTPFQMVIVCCIPYSWSGNMIQDHAAGGAVVKKAPTPSKRPPFSTPCERNISSEKIAARIGEGSEKCSSPSSSGAAQGTPPASKASAITPRRTQNSRRKHSHFFGFVFFCFAFGRSVSFFLSFLLLSQCLSSLLSVFLHFLFFPDACFPPFSLAWRSSENLLGPQEWVSVGEWRK